MGLAERRMINAFKDEKYPDFKKQIDAAAGFDVPVEITWDLFADDQWEFANRDPSFVSQALGETYFVPLVKMLTAVCADQMGKDAVKASLKKVVVTPGDISSAESSGKFENGVFTVTHKPFSNTHHIDQKANSWRKVLESKL